MGKFYATKVGRVSNVIHTSWEECEKNVKGYSGAIFKSFANRTDAENYLRGEEHISPVISPIPQRSIGHSPFQNQTVMIYTDGSHSKVVGGHIGYGAYCSFNGQEYAFSGKITSERLSQYGIDPQTEVSNPTAEFLGFAEVLRMFYSAQVKISPMYKLVFAIDYIGVQAWMTGTWQRKLDHIRKIYDSCQQMIQAISLTQYEIIHVAGHSGVHGNTQADILAKGGSISVARPFIELIYLLKL